MVAFTCAANATLVGLKECTCTNLTLKLEGFPLVRGNPWEVKVGGLAVESLYEFTGQTMVLTRPPTLVGGKYWIEIFRNGVLFANREVTVCDCAAVVCDVAPGPICETGPMGPQGPAGVAGQKGEPGIGGAMGSSRSSWRDRTAGPKRASWAQRLERRDRRNWGCGNPWTGWSDRAGRPHWSAWPTRSRRSYRS